MDFRLGRSASAQGSQGEGDIIFGRRCYFGAIVESEPHIKASASFWPHCLAQFSSRASPRATRSSFSVSETVRMRNSRSVGVLSGSGDRLSQGAMALLGLRRLVALEPLHCEPNRPVIIRQVVADPRQGMKFVLMKSEGLPV